ncbi:MAG: exodeoxyribonuclease VII large subunit [Deltaproteobacteria bacterium]|jgi:exodeoxyribonuclease VII large subunit|nr:exodeoxyribonuclease VII large subunit [Deltaproteobacteria bacterium]
MSAQDRPAEIFTPTSLTNRIDSLFRERFPKVYVEGEISGRFRQGSGHLYFYLNDAKSKIKAIIWSSNRGRAASIAEDGLNVLACGHLTTYYARSEYQLIVDSMEPRGEGALRLAFEKLKARLLAEGLFNAARKRKLPFWPRRVALLTSPKGAAVEDFLKTAFKRFPQAAITIYPVKVQGEGAAAEMAAAVEDVNSWGGFDLIVLTRGGGSLEDLWAYNEEILVRAVANSRILTFAAVGHATDLSLAELAADGSAITPTAAAERIFPDKARILEDLTLLRKRLEKSAGAKLNEKAAEIRELKHRLLNFQHRLKQESLQIDGLVERLVSLISLALLRSKGELEKLKEKLNYLSPGTKIARQKEELENLVATLAHIKLKLLAPFFQELNHAVDRLQLISPLVILTRGYSLATLPDGRVLRSSASVKMGDTFLLTLSEGKIRARVDSILAAAAGKKA